ncbi:MAG: hypothetical protein M3308_01105 [Actinomycetota bacterium]|nr:hypothetical protein [Actinomycetota bacterium]
MAVQEPLGGGIPELRSVERIRHASYQLSPQRRRDDLPSSHLSTSLLERRETLPRLLNAALGVISITPS